MILLSAAFVPITHDKHRQTEKCTSCSLILGGLHPNYACLLIINLVLVSILMFMDCSATKLVCVCVCLGGNTTLRPIFHDPATIAGADLGGGLWGCNPPQNILNQKIIFNF